MKTKRKPGDTLIVCIERATPTPNDYYAKGLDKLYSLRFDNTDPDMDDTCSIFVVGNQPYEPGSVLVIRLRKEKVLNLHTYNTDYPLWEVITNENKEEV